jgi:hypothetical protein
MMTIAFVLCGLIAGFGFGYIAFSSERAYRQGWLDGEHYGRTEGYREAYRKFHRPLLNTETEDWNE